LILGRNDRGGMILGFAALTFVLGMLCSIVLLRSMDSYRATALATQRMQARAAAEGAAVLIRADGPTALGQPLQLGDCIVRSDAPADGATSVGLRVEVHPNGSPRASLLMRYLLAAGDATTTGAAPRLELQL